LKNKSAIGIFAPKGGTTIKRANNSIGQIGLRGAGNGYDEIFEVNIEKGRYLTGDEVEAGRNVGLIGYEVAKALFPKDDPIGEIVKISNLKFKVVGTIKKEGESFLGTPSNDYTVIVPYNAFRKLYQTGTGVPNELQSIIGIKGNAFDVGLVELENELRGLLRTKRGLRPLEKTILHSTDPIPNASRTTSRPPREISTFDLMR